MIKRLGGLGLAAALGFSDGVAADWGAVNPTFNANLSRIPAALSGLAMLPNDRLWVAGAFDRANDQQATNLLVVAPDGTFSHPPKIDAFTQVISSTPLKSGGLVVFGISRNELNQSYTSGLYRIRADGSLMEPNPYQSTLSSSWSDSLPVLHPDGLLTFKRGSRFFQIQPDGTLLRTFEAPQPSQFYLGNLIAGLNGGRFLINLNRRFSGGSLIGIADPQGALESTPMIPGYCANPYVKPAADGSFFAVKVDGYSSLVKFDADGALAAEFQSPFGESTSFDSILPTSEGGALVAGSLQLPTQITNQFIYRTLAKISPTGTLDVLFDEATRHLGYLDRVAQGPSNCWFVAEREIGGTVLRKMRSDGTIDSAFTIKLQLPPVIEAVAHLDDGRLAVGAWEALSVDEFYACISIRNLAGGKQSIFFNDHIAQVVDLLAMPDGGFMAQGYPGSGVPQIRRFRGTGAAIYAFWPDVDFSGSSSPYRSLYRLPDGKVLIGGGNLSAPGTNPFFVNSPILRFAQDGKPDPTFLAHTEFAPGNRSNSLLPLPDGRIFLSGTFTDPLGRLHPSLVRLNTNGTVDRTFSHSAAEPHRHLMALHANGQALLGHAESTNSVYRARPLVRTLPSGGFDPEFSSALGAPTTITAAAVQSDGRILIGGTLFDRNGAPLDAVVRLEPDGQLDPSFSARFTPSPLPPRINRILVLPDGDILVAGMFEMDGQFSLVKLRSAEKPRLRPVSISDSSLMLELSGNTGKTYAVQSSSNLVDWLPAGTVTLDSATRTTPVPLSGDGGGRFHRAVLVTEP